MKVYITRSSASSILFGGLERLNVWFEKPVYEERTRYDPEKLPFGPGVQAGTYTGGEWTVVTPGKVERKSFSFGNVFGYADSKDEKINELASHVWKKLHEHFQNIPFSEEWEKLEQNKISNVKDFFLEIDLAIEMKK